MTNYLFKDQYFALSETSIHLLRNGYNYKTLPFSTISSVKFKRGNGLKNRYLLIVLGIGMILFAIFYLFQVYNFFNSVIQERFYVEELFIPLFSSALGSYILYASSKQEALLIVSSEKIHTLTIKELNQGDLISFLKSKTKVVN